MEQSTRQQFGLKGSVCISNGTAEGKFVAIDFHEETVVSAIVAPSIENSELLERTWSAGQRLYGAIESITVDSGLAQCYRDAD